MTPEKKVKIKVYQQLKALGCYYFNPMTFGYGSSGVPDIVGCFNGKFFGIECKANGNKPTALQLRNLEAIKDAGGHALVVDEHNVHEVGEWIQAM